MTSDDQRGHQVPIYHTLFPPELIADEYFRHNKDNAIMYIFYDMHHEPHVEKYKNIFENDTCKCAHMFPITKHDQVLTDIDTILNQQSHDDKDCFMLLFLGTLTEQKVPDLYVTKDKPIKGVDVWRPIANSERIIYRPKIFIFHAFVPSSAGLKTDGPKLMQAPYEDPEAIYTIPREADVLIVYKKTTHNDCQPSIYFSNLFKNLDQFGDRDDFVNILSYTKTGTEYDAHPLIVSTLRKKVYMTNGKYRGHWSDIRKHMDNYIEELELILHNINQYLQNKGSGSEPTNRLDSGTVADDVSVVDNPNVTVPKIKRNRRRLIPNEDTSYTTIFLGLFWVILLCAIMIGLCSSLIK